MVAKAAVVAEAAVERKAQWGSGEGSQRNVMYAVPVMELQ